MTEYAKRHQCKGMSRVERLGNVVLGKTIKVCPFCGVKV